jgi:hypothetical protein
MLQAQQAQAGVVAQQPTATTPGTTDSAKKDAAQVSGQVQATPQNAAYQYATNPYYLQQQQMLAAQQAQVAGQPGVTPQVVPTPAPVVPGQAVINTTNATLPGQEGWSVPAQTPNPTAEANGDAQLIGKRSAPTDDATPAPVQDATTKEIKE